METERKKKSGSEEKSYAKTKTRNLGREIVNVVLDKDCFINYCIANRFAQLFFQFVLNVLGKTEILDLPQSTGPDRCIVYTN